MTDVAGQARRASNSAWFEHGVRVGLLAYGVVHLLIGWLALQLAFGDSSGSASSQGALNELAAQPLGQAMLWLVTVGFGILALWQLTEALWGHRRENGAKRVAKRLASAGRLVLYTALAVSAAKTAVGSGSSGSSTDSWTHRLMDLPFGQVLVGLVGAGIIGVGVVLAKRGVTRSFAEDLEPLATSGHTGTGVVRIGQAGYLAKAVALAVVGGLFGWAAWTYDAQKAGGLDVALRTLLDATAGPYLLGLVAVGIVCFGVYCFAWAWYADTDT